MFSTLFQFCFRAFAFLFGLFITMGGLICTYWAISSRGKFFIDRQVIFSKPAGFLVGLFMGIMGIYLGIGLIEVAFRP